MIVEYKSKFDRTMEELKEYLQEKDFERWYRIFKGQAIENDRIAISNGFIGLKFKIRDLYKDLDTCYKKNKIAKDVLELESIDSDIRKQYIEYIYELNNYIDRCQKILNTLAGVLINLYIPLIDKHFNKKEIIQIIGGSYEEVNKINAFIERKETGTNSITESYIIHHVEYRWRKGRSKDFIDCPNWEMPLFNCISDYMLEEIHKNSEASNKMSNIFEEMFGEYSSSVTLDSNGNVINIEKIIQEVSIKELLKNYRGNFIRELRKGNIFSEEKIKIKKLKDNVYCILDEDNKEGEKIYKKIS